MLRKLLASVVALPLIVVAAPAVRSNMLVSTDWLAQHLKDPKLVILEVSRDRKAYDAGHIPGSRFLALGDITVTRDGILNELPPVADLKKVFEAAGVSDDSHVILVPDASPIFATRAYFTLDYLGHGDNASLLDGGLPKWKMESKMVSTDTPTMELGKFTPKVHAEVVAHIDDVKGAGSKALLLDARTAKEYSGGTEASAEIPRPGHIPGAANLFWQQGQVNKDDMSLLSEAQLRKTYEGAGVSQDRPVITYCNTGMQASQAYFTLKYLGYDAKMYDGSFSEWSNYKDTPVEK